MYETTIENYVTVATNNRYTFPGGANAFNSYLENQSYLINEVLAKKLDCKIKSIHIKYERDTTNLVSSFKITLNLLGSTYLGFSFENSAIISKAFTQSAQELNPGKLLKDIPYKSEMLNQESFNVGHINLHFREQPSKKFERDYWGNINTVSYDYLIPTPQKTYGSLKNSGSPITKVGDWHEKLVKQVMNLISVTDTKFAPFINALEKRNYPKALRCACTSDDAHVLKLIEILLSYKEKLNFDINEQAGEKNYAAIHYAASKSSKDVYEFLIQHGANPNLEANGVSAKGLAETRFNAIEKKISNSCN